MTTADDVKNYVDSKIGRMNIGDPRSTAMLAILRRGAGKTLIDSPETWEEVLSDIPEQLVGHPTKNGYAVSNSEDAIFTALTLYAVHQQGNSKSMNQTGISVGDGAKELMISLKENEEGVKRRFKAIITSAEPSELKHHLRGMIQMMRSSEIGLDYGQLAKDLYLYSNPEWRANIRIRWGEDFYKLRNETDSANIENKE